MSDDKTTPTPETGDQENWEQRYVGLQKVVAKRDADLAARQAALDALTAEHEAIEAELAEKRQAEADAREEAEAAKQYEALKERFEAAPPRPVGNNPVREEWYSGGGKRREQYESPRGFPT